MNETIRDNIANDIHTCTNMSSHNYSLWKTMHEWLVVANTKGRAEKIAVNGKKK